MTRMALRTVLFLLAVLVLSSPAQAVVNNPDGTLSKDGQPGEAAPPTAGQIKDAAKGAEARENAASKSIEEMVSKAAAPAQTRQPPQPASGSWSPGASGAGGRRAIYGDIIIHK